MLTFIINYLILSLKGCLLYFWKKQKVRTPNELSRWSCVQGVLCGVHPSSFDHWPALLAVFPRPEPQATSPILRVTPLNYSRMKARPVEVSHTNHHYLEQIWNTPVSHPSLLWSVRILVSNSTSLLVQNTGKGLMQDSSHLLRPGAMISLKHVLTSLSSHQLYSFGMDYLRAVLYSTWG